MKNVDVSTLLTIDVGAEVRKLSKAQVDGPGALAVELAREAIAEGASSVEITIGRRSLSVTAGGEGQRSPPPSGRGPGGGGNAIPSLAHERRRESRTSLDEEPTSPPPSGRGPGGGGPATPSLDDDSRNEQDRLDSLAILLDRTRPPEDRHHALLALESARGLAWIALAGLEATRIRVQSPAGSIELAGGRVSRGAPGPSSVQIDGIAIDPRAARARIERACRFSPVPIHLDGRELPRGFRSVLAHAELRAPLDGVIGIPEAGTGATLSLLVHGLEVAHVTLPEAPAFEAAIEMRASPDHAPSALREAIEPRVPDLIDAVVSVLVACAARPAAAARESQRARLAEQLLIAARTGPRSREVRDAKIFPSAGGALLSLREIASLPQPVAALFPGNDPKDHLLPEVAVPILGSAERSRIAALLDLTFQPPPRLPGASRWRGAVEDLRRSLAKLKPGRRALEPDALDPDERAFAEALAAAAGAPVRFADGRGKARHAAGGWLVPRAEPAVLSARRAWTVDPAWIYPAALALLPGVAPAHEARARWLDSRG